MPMHNIIMSYFTITFSVILFRGTINNVNTDYPLALCLSIFTPIVLPTFYIFLLLSSSYFFYTCVLRKE
ncbi:hypothetical protein BDF14DRAFT_1802053 [Spinellus fusiger]|nr:hypothetical protein BDF14DRAFT_1802053 [Spinellus fusiger]